MARTPKKTEVADYAPCKFAFDKEDDFCKTCDGITLQDQAGGSYPAVDCQGYEAAKEVEPVAKKEEKQQVVEPQEKPISSAVEEQVGNEPQEKVEAEIGYNPLGITTTIRAESGLSVELKDRQGLSRWYKFSYAEERTIPPNADKDAEKESLWNEVNRTIDQQLDDTLAYLEQK